ncbi:GcrA cell cycle regulator [Methylobacterium sp. SD274]|jgi:GcrA cell cycle regulator|nr:GcrA cell cycle regulator [Methylobacterium sp. SD274]
MSEGAMTDTGAGWTDERVELLRRLWDEGLSASQIAAQLGGVTRNAVIGKVHRLGLSGRVKAADSPGNGRKKPAARAPETEADTVVEFAPVADPVATPSLAFPETTALVMPQATPLAVSKRVTIMDLRESMCRWPLGDPTSPDFHYCGDRSITGLPYCTHHAQIAYQPAAERKRDRRVGGFR